MSIAEGLDDLIPLCTALHFEAMGDKVNVSCESYTDILDHPPSDWTQKSKLFMIFLSSIIHKYRVRIDSTKFGEEVGQLVEVQGISPNLLAFVCLCVSILFYLFYFCKTHLAFDNSGRQVIHSINSQQVCRPKTRRISRIDPGPEFDERISSWR